MQILKYLKNLKSFSVIIVPDDTSHEAKSKKFTLTRIITLMIIYSVISAVLGYYIFSFTGFDKVFPGKDVQGNVSIEERDQLNEKIIFLAKELQLLKSANQRLKYALALGDTTLVDSFKINPDTLRQIYKTRKEGNLFGSIADLVQKIFSLQENTIYFILPVNGYISRGFDPERGHYGIDIVVNDGTPIYAAAGGFVVFSGYTNNYGHIIILNHPEGYLSIYKHCSLILKKERDFVKQGDLIALSGNSGLATTGPHLHFEIWQNGIPVDPETLIIITKL